MTNIYTDEQRERIKKTMPDVGRRRTPRMESTPRLA